MAKGTKDPKGNAEVETPAGQNLPATTTDDKHEISLALGSDDLDIASFLEEIANPPKGRLPLNATFLKNDTDFEIGVEQIFGFIKMDVHVSTDERTGEESTVDAVVLLNGKGEVKKTTSVQIVNCCRTLPPFDGKNRTRISIIYNGQIKHPKFPARKINDFNCRLVG